MKLQVEPTEQTARELRRLSLQQSDASLKSARMIGAGLMMVALALVFLGVVRELRSTSVPR